MPLETVIVIGGGLAGLSSAVALAEAGCRVRVFEKRPHLGGRAASYDLPDGSHVDNCQHVTLGCCTNLADFYRRVGVDGKIRFYDELHFADVRGSRFRIHPSLLPPPFHLAPSLFRFSALHWSDKRAIARALLSIARAGGRPRDAAGSSMLEWLERQRQTRAAIHRFWRVVLVSALDEELDRIDAQYGADVFWKAFLASRAGFRIGIPRVALGELYDGCRAAIERQGGEVRTRAAVRQFRFESGRLASAVLDDSSILTGDACISAVPHEAVLQMLPRECLERDAALAGLCHLRASPITGVHLWFDRAVMREPFLTLLDHTVQWIFNKSLLYRSESGEDSHQKSDSPPSSAHPIAPESGQYLQLVISASYDWVARSRQEILDLCFEDLAEVLPATKEARLLKGTVIKEVSATFSPEPGSDRWRPAQKSPLDGFFFAGDWTRTGWPATMEGAVRSGYLAAEAVLVRLGRPKKLLQPDLHAEGFAKFWARRRNRSES